VNHRASGSIIFFVGLHSLLYSLDIKKRKMGHYQIIEWDNPESNYPESRVLIIGTGGTICMQPTPDGLQPIGGFLESAMAPRPSFNDMSPTRGTFPICSRALGCSVSRLGF
jgi:L-asparaginase/Glu-tRNA(Gln) amidotransferase subunit D